MSNVIKDQKEKLLQLVKDAIAKDDSLREKFKVGDKFRFIRDRLKTLYERVEEHLGAMVIETEKKVEGLATDELLVYVYLFNAQGLVFSSWKKMVNPAVFYEYSVNRPIYSDKSHVEAIIRTKSNRVQHAFLTVAVKKEFILTSPLETKDINGNLLIKVKEGMLKIDRVQSFTHNGIDYEITPEGELIKKV